MNNYTYYYILLLFTSVNFYAQNILKGNIENTDNIKLTNVSITVKDENNKNISYGYSDSEGNYVVKFQNFGKHKIYFSKLNYTSNEIEVYCNSNIVIVNNTLTYKAIELNEVVIKPERPIEKKGDTIIYNVKSFITGNENVAEDLLKKLPGINVAKDGTVKVGNQEVEKIMVEGDDFFERGYKLLTKNMPVSPIEKVEIIKNYSSNKLLKGIEKSNKIAINLKLNKEAKRQWFGNVNLGYGLVSASRYNVKSNLMNFGKKNKYYFIANLNNDGSDALGDVNSFVYNFNDNDAVGTGQETNTLINIAPASVEFESKRFNFNNNEMVSLNNIINLNDKNKLKITTFLNLDENDNFRNSTTQYQNNSFNFLIQENDVLRTKNHVFFTKINFDAEFSKNKLFEYSISLNSLKKNSNKNMLFNQTALNEKLFDTNRFINQSLVYTYKINEKNVLLVSARNIIENETQKYSGNGDYESLFNFNSNRNFQNLNNDLNFYGVDLNFINKQKNGNLIEIKAGNTLRIDTVNSDFTLQNTNNEINTPISYQNRFKYCVNDYYLKTSYGFGFEKFKFINYIDVHFFKNRLESFSENNVNQLVFINPNSSIYFKANKKNSLMLSLSYNKTNLKSNEIYTNYINSSFRNFTKGTGTLNTLYVSNYSLSYNYGNTGDKFTANTSVTYNLNDRFLTNNSFISQNFAFSENILLNDKKTVAVTTNINKYFRVIQSSLKFNLNYSNSDFKNIINNSDVRDINNTNYLVGFEVNSAFNGFFNYSIGSSWNYNRVKTNFTNDFLNNSMFATFNFEISDKFNIDLENERYYFGALSKNNNTYYFVDLQAKYNLIENKLSISLVGNNLTNTKNFKNYTINDFSTNFTEIRLLERFLMLKMEFKF